MAYAAWKDIVIQHGRSGPLFRVYDAVTNKLTGAMAGSWTIVDRSTDTVWASDTDPADGSWLVLESQSARGDGSKLQVFLGFRNTTGALAGFGSKAAGVYTCMSPDGQWGHANGYFGSALSNWRNAIKSWKTTYATPCTMGVLMFEAGDNGRPGTFCCAVRSGTGDLIGSVAGGLVPLIGLSHANSRAAHCCGIARLSNGPDYWGWWGSGTTGNVPTPAMDASDGSYTWTACPARDRESGAYAESDAVIIDFVTSTSVGVLELIRGTNMPDGDISVDGTRHAWSGVSYPRESGRDGIWG